MDLQQSVFEFIPVGPRLDNTGTAGATLPTSLTVYVRQPGSTSWVSTALSGTNVVGNTNALMLALGMAPTNKATVGSGWNLIIPPGTNGLYAMLTADVLPTASYAAKYSGGTVNASTSALTAQAQADVRSAMAPLGSGIGTFTGTNGAGYVNTIPYTTAVNLPLFTRLSFTVANSEDRANGVSRSGFLDGSNVHFFLSLPQAVLAGDQFIATPAMDALGDVTAGIYPIAVDSLGRVNANIASIGSGSCLVNHSTPTADYMRVLNVGQPVAGVTVTAYLTSVYISGGASEATNLGQTTTTADGRWAASIGLTPATSGTLSYTIEFRKPGEFQTQTTTLTIDSAGNVTVP